MEQMEAKILHTVFRNEENGYSVLAVRSGREECTVVGVLPELADGEKVIFSGEWTEHKSYGTQFKSVGCEILAPSTAPEMERYLASGMIRGVGESLAHMIVAHFGAETMAVLAEHPARLTEVSGIGKKKAAMIAESFREQQGTRRAMVFLQTYGISPALAVRIAQCYGDRTPDLLRENPYRICEDMEGIGFKTADRIAGAMGIPPDHDQRIQSALKYVLQEASYVSGHVYLPEQELIRQAADMLRVPAALCETNMRTLLLRGELVAEAEEDGSRRVYTASFYEAETETAGRLLELMAAYKPRKKTGAKRAVAAFERSRGISFSELQREAILRAVESGVFVITGGPGTGKTTIINCILQLLSQEGITLLCAPTGRAAKRMTEATGTESKTIHRLLEYSREEGQFMRNEENPLEADCLIVDEASMIDLPLMLALLRAMELGCRLILVGDADQLPSVGPGNVLRDILGSETVPHVRLKEIYRQSESSRIALNAHRVNGGEMPLMNGKDTDFFFERKPYAADAAQAVVALASERLPIYLKYAAARELHDGKTRKKALQAATQNIQVLAPGKKGACGVNALNALLQEALNPSGAFIPELTWGDTTFRPGDKVIQTRNNYDLAWTRITRNGEEDGTGVFNGDIGFVQSVDTENHSLTVLYDEERFAEYAAADLDDLSLAYCLSVHKSQGSEFPAVILPVVGGPPMLLTRNLFYTAITRARGLVVLVGTEEVIHTMVTNDYVSRRYSTLEMRLRSMMQP